jgi:poly(ADP-ribose) polymerase-like protein
VPHVFELASTGRAKCRGCGQAIARGDLRFGERLPNAFGEGEMTLWFHPLCAAYKRPESVLQTLAESPGSVPDAAALERAALFSSSHRRLPRIDGAERAPGGQAKCRHCKEKIEKGAWRIRLVFFEESRFMPGGFVHLDCRNAYFERDDVFEPLLHFSPALSDEDRAELARAAGADPARAKR